jgi:hypothetical protein
MQALLLAMRATIAAQGNNYFGIHYPAPFAAGYMLAERDGRMAAFASFADSLRAFVGESGSVIQGLSGPTAFAAVLQAAAGKKEGCER